MFKTLYQIPKPLKITTIRTFLDEFKSVFGTEKKEYLMYYLRLLNQNLI